MNVHVDSTSLCSQKFKFIYTPAVCWYLQRLFRINNTSLLQIQYIYENDQ